MAKQTKAQLRARMKNLMAKAKKIRKAHPGKKWTACVAAAAKKK
jgi:hypothetical protein